MLKSGMAVYAETSRLVLRSLEESDLPRLVELIDTWDIIRWLAVVPYPYSMKNAEDFYTQQAELYRRGTPECYAIASRTDNAIMGAVGMRPELQHPEPDNGALGYWLGKAYWGQGFMGEAVQAVIAHTFGNDPNRSIITAITDIANQASQNVLRKAGFDYLGTRPRPDKGLRGSPEVTCWRLDNARSQKLEQRVERKTENVH